MATKKSVSTKKPPSVEDHLPLHRFYNLLLVVAVMAVYLSTLKLGYTELDDSIFIKETHQYNENLSNLGTSFHRGVFNETADVYYRPLLLDSFILNYQISKDNIKGWHAVNIFLHLISVLLLFVLLKKIGINELSAFLLSLFFAVHPVLSQAVAWIPGRNDTLLAIFTFTYLIAAIRYDESKRVLWLLIQFCSLLAALFTKETAVFAAPVAWMLVVFLRKRNWFSRTNIFLYTSWLAAGLIWLFIRSEATLKNSDLQFGEVLKTFPARLPVLIQYLGKIFLPLNLNVFPITQDTTYVYGIASVFIIGGLLYFTRNSNRQMIIAGFAIYVLLFIPALMVPASLNDQDFEHRIYLPMFGILMVLSESVLLRNSLTKRSVLIGGIVVCAVLAAVNLHHQKNFNDPVTFWSAAQKASPHSAYATMMLGARLDKTDPKKADELIRKAYAMDSDQKYINYYMGVLLQTHDSIIPSEKYFLKEIKISDYFQCYFHLARVAFERKDQQAAIHYLEIYLNRNPSDEQGNNNLLLLYLDSGQKEKARQQAERMKQEGINVPGELLERIK